MNKSEFKTIIYALGQAASRQGINLEDPENTVTVWLRQEHRIGSVEYRWLGNATDIEHAKILAGPRHAIIRTSETGRVQIIVWQDRRWVDGYAEEDQPPIVLA